MLYILFPPKRVIYLFFYGLLYIIFKVTEEVYTSALLKLLDGDVFRFTSLIMWRPNAKCTIGTCVLIAGPTVCLEFNVPF